MNRSEVMYKGSAVEKANSVILKNGNFYWHDDQIKAVYAEEKAKAFRKKKSKNSKTLKKLKKCKLTLTLEAE